MPCGSLFQEIRWEASDACQCCGGLAFVQLWWRAVADFLLITGEVLKTVPLPSLAKGLPGGGEGDLGGCSQDAGGRIERITS